METIKNYLESMFATLPNTAEVMRAKNELYTMMEDKYNELIADGKAENEAVGIVISEFGNLDEVAESLGIGDVMKGFDPEDRHNITLDEAKSYIIDESKHKFCIALAVLLFILSPCAPILLSNDYIMGGGFYVAGVVGLFLMVAAGVGIIIYSTVQMNKWKILDEYPCQIDYATADYIYQEQQYNRGNRALLLTIGIMLCVVCVLPPVVINGMFSSVFLNELFGVVMMFVFVGCGVMLIIFSGAKEGAYRKLLSLNDITTVSGNYESTRAGRNVTYSNPLLAGIMSVYWNTVTAIYLIWSFLFWDWGRSWIIWPIAGVISWALKSVGGAEGGKK